MAVQPLPAQAPGKTSVSGTAQVRKTGADSASDKDMFLKLMIAQLKNQDPSSPMDSKDMMASITQMSQVEQQMNQSKALASLALSQSVGMVDKTIQFTTTIKDADGNVMRDETVVGTVDHVTQKNGSVKLAVTVLGTLNDDGSVTPAGTNNIVSVDIDQVTMAG
jgi:flagellar basal-body rod modification protein FlgD